jgi:hypothetical protein
MFQKATRKKAKLKIALVGPSGSGKTYSALLVAKGMGGKIAVIDTERSAELYADDPRMPAYDVAHLEKFEPEEYIAKIKFAEKSGYDILIIDSMTPEWTAVKEIAEKVGTAMNNSWAGWSKATPRHQSFIDAIIQSPMHIFCTMRAKTEWTTAKDEKTGKSKPVKLGLGAEQRQGVDFEFTTIFNISAEDHLATVDKDRTNRFVNFTDKLSERTGETFNEWINSAAAEEDPLAARKNYVFVLLSKLNLKYEGDVKTKLNKQVNKTSMTEWSAEDIEAVIKTLEDAIAKKKPQ